MHAQIIESIPYTGEDVDFEVKFTFAELADFFDSNNVICFMKTFE
jgi:hypothetical protein